MKLLFALSLLASAISSGGESSLTTTYHPFRGLGHTRITIAPVICHDWYSHSGGTTDIHLISAKNVPPTNNTKEAVDDVNLASLCQVYFDTSDFGNPSIKPEMTMNLTKFKDPKDFGFTREDVVRSCLECLRRCLPEKLMTVPLQLEATDADKEWASKITAEFNSHDRSKVFFTPQQ